MTICDGGTYVVSLSNTPILNFTRNDDGTITVHYGLALSDGSVEDYGTDTYSDVPKCDAPTTAVTEDHGDTDQHVTHGAPTEASSTSVAAPSVTLPATGATTTLAVAGAGILVGGVFAILAAHGRKDKQ